MLRLYLTPKHNFWKEIRPAAEHMNAAQNWWMWVNMPSKGLKLGSSLNILLHQLHERGRPGSASWTCRLAVTQVPPARKALMLSFMFPSSSEAPHIFIWPGFCKPVLGGVGDGLWTAIASGQKDISKPSGPRFEMHWASLSPVLFIVKRNRKHVPLAVQALSGEAVMDFHHRR